MRIGARVKLVHPGTLEVLGTVCDAKDDRVCVDWDPGNDQPAWVVKSRLTITGRGAVLPACPQELAHRPATRRGFSQAVRRRAVF